MPKFGFPRFPSPAFGFTEQWGEGLVRSLDQFTALLNAALPQEGEIEPTVTYATPGDFSPTYTTQKGRFIRNGTLCHFYIQLQFTTNAYTTASGNFIISGLPFEAYTDGVVNVGRLQNCTLSGSSSGAYVVGSSTTIKLVENVSNSSPTTWGTTQVPASKSDVIIELAGVYPVAAL